MPTPVAALRLRGCTQLSHVSCVFACGTPPSAALLRSPLTTVTYSFNGASGSRMNGNSKSRPVRVGSHSSCSAPCGKYTKPSRRPGVAAVFASAVPAGTIASSNGSAIDAPAPRSTVRRDRCFRFRNIARSSSNPLLQGRRLDHLRGFFRLVEGLSLPESIARHDTEHDGLEAVVVALG